jgi:hypothetical protein
VDCIQLDAKSNRFHKGLELATLLLAGYCSAMFGDRYHKSGPPRTKAVRIMRIALGFAGTALIIWALSSLPYDTFREERIRALGEHSTRGVVFSKRTEPDSDGPLYLITYRYSDMEGIEHVGMANLPRDRWQRLNKGDRIKVFFARANPALSRAQFMIEPAFQIKLRQWIRGD